MRSSRVKSFLAGVLVANSAPHLGTAVMGNEHPTPIGGRRSGPGANTAWAVLNLAGGVLLLAVNHTAGRS